MKVDYQSADDKHFDSVLGFLGAAGNADSTLFNFSLLGRATGSASIEPKTLDEQIYGLCFEGVDLSFLDSSGRLFDGFEDAIKISIRGS